LLLSGRWIARVACAWTVVVVVVVAATTTHAPIGKVTVVVSTAQDVLGLLKAAGFAASSLTALQSGRRAEGVATLTVGKHAGAIIVSGLTELEAGVVVDSRTIDRLHHARSIAATLAGAGTSTAVYGPAASVVPLAAIVAKLVAGAGDARCVHAKIHDVGCLPSEVCAFCILLLNAAINSGQ
jgi:hypothetical protein